MARNKEFNETEVLQKALLLFQTKGYNATSAQDLVDTLGISRSSLYNTFVDKKTLFLKTLEHYKTTESGKLIQMLHNSSNVLDTILQMFDTIVEDADNSLPKGCFMVNSSVEVAPHDCDMANIIHQNIQDVETALQIAIEKGQQTGVISRKQSSVTLARFIFNNITGLRVATKNRTDKIIVNDIKLIVESVLRP